MSRWLSEIVLSCVRKFSKDERGNVFLIVALALPLLIGAIGLGAEVSYWRVLHREMQNAADSAAIAAATNNSPSYAGEAQGVTSQYGFTNGVNQVSVAVSNPATAAGCTANCYVVTVSQKVPLLLSQVIGYTGDATVGGQRAVTIAATAVTQVSSTSAYPYCILALASSGVEGINTNGAPKADLFGCDVMSDTSATCNGHNLDANVGDAVTTNNGCGIVQNSGAPYVADPYLSRASNIPSDNCGGSYPQEPAKKKDPALPASNKLSGTYSFPSTKVLCGDQQLVGNTTINNTTLVIENGQLDTNGYTFQGTDTTVIFSGSPNGSYTHAPTGGGTVDITPPNSGNWSGVAIYQDPALTTGVNISAAGNSPTWNISGLIYLPHSSVLFSGAVNKSANGYRCFTMVIDNIRVNGTADIFANDNQCDLAGLAQPMGGTRGQLVN